MADAAPIVVVTDTMAGGTVSGDVGDVERPSTDPRALSCQLVMEKASNIVTKSRRPGQEGGPARPVECRARQSAYAMRTVSVAKAAVAHGRPEREIASMAASRRRSRPEPTLQLDGKM